MAMKNTAKCILVLAAVGMLGLVGCGKSDDDGSASSGPVYDSPTVQKVAFNTVCPIKGNAVVEGSFVDFNGQTVGFCCDDCIEKFEGLDDAAKTTLLASLDSVASPVGDGQNEGRDSDKGEEQAAEEGPDDDG